MENMNQNNQTAGEQQEKTFTQEQVNAIVGKRLSEQKQQQEADLAKKADELNKREMAIRAKELLCEKRLPEGLAEVLKYDNEDDHSGHHIHRHRKNVFLHDHNAT